MTPDLRKLGLGSVLIHADDHNRDKPVVADTSVAPAIYVSTS